MSKMGHKTPRGRQKLPTSGKPELLRNQKFSSGNKAETQSAAMSNPAQSEVIPLASGERRQVIIERTTDKEWDNLVLLIEGATSLLLDQKDLTHRAIAAIADLRAAHDDDW